MYLLTHVATSFVLFLLVVAIGRFRTWRSRVTLATSNEPPIVRHIVPFVGHLWGLMKHAHEYVNGLRYARSLVDSTCPTDSILILVKKRHMLSSHCLSLWAKCMS